MGAAWREVRDNSQFDRVLEMVRGVNALGVEVCCTLGMLTADQAHRLKEAGLYAYNHNLDTSARVLRPDHHDADLPGSARHHRQRPADGHLASAAAGSSAWGRPRTTGRTPAHPGDPARTRSPYRSTCWSPRAGYPARRPARRRDRRHRAGDRDGPDPDADVDGAHRGRPSPMSSSDQALCFLAGANSIFSSEEGMMLTEAVPCAEHDGDAALLAGLGLHPRVLVT